MLFLAILGFSQVFAMSIEEAQEQVMILKDMMNQIGAAKKDDGEYKRIHKELQKLESSLGRGKKTTPKQIQWIEKSTAWAESNLEAINSKQESTKDDSASLSLAERKKNLKLVIRNQIKYAEERAMLAGTPAVQKHTKNLTELLKQVDRSQSIQENQKIFAKFKNYQDNFRNYLAEQAQKNPGRTKPVVDIKRENEFNIRDHFIHAEKYKAKVPPASYQLFIMDLKALRLKNVAAQSMIEVQAVQNRLQLARDKFDKMVP